MLFVGIARCLQPSDLKSTAQIRFDLGQPGVYRSTSPFHRHFAVRPLGFVDSSSILPQCIDSYVQVLLLCFKP
jgi:hypothetical protein